MVTIVGLGAICVDRLAIIPRLPGWDEVEYISESIRQQGGIVATAMVAAARLGEHVECIGGLGDDDAGRYALTEFEKAGVRTDRIVIFPGEMTTFSFVLVHQESGKRTILNHRGVQEHASLGDISLNFSGSRFLHLDGYWFETAMRMAQHARARDMIITLDPSSRLLHNSQAPKLFRYVDYFMPGYALAHRFTGEADPFHAATALLQHGFQAVIITKGEAGCFVATSEEHYHLPAFEVPVVDTTGAGDTFHGAFVAGLSKGYHLRQALQFASAVAALKCTKLGGQAGIPTFQETQRFLANHGLAGF